MRRKIFLTNGWHLRNNSSFIIFLIFLSLCSHPVALCDLQLYYDTIAQFWHIKHRWFSGRMLACHAGGPGSIPGRCIFLHFDPKLQSHWCFCCWKILVTRRPGVFCYYLPHLMNSNMITNKILYYLRLFYLLWKLLFLMGYLQQ
jgi:hypothetical protein